MQAFLLAGRVGRRTGRPGGRILWFALGALLAGHGPEDVVVPGHADRSALAVRDHGRRTAAGRQIRRSHVCGEPQGTADGLAAGLAVGTSDVGIAGSAGIIAVFVIVVVRSVSAPLVVSLVGGDATLQRLATAREWLQRNIAAVVLGLIGVFLLVGGPVKV